MNRLDEEQEPAPEPAAACDYFVVSAESSAWLVSTVMARCIEAQLDEDPCPQWVTFVDLSGSRVRLRSQDIEYLAQSTAEQRAADRAFNRILKQERKRDRSWDGDE